MRQTIIELLFIWIAFTLGIYAEHIRDIVRGLRNSPSDWRSIMSGMWDSGSIPVFFILIAISIGIIFLNRAHNKSVIKSEEKRNAEFIEALNKGFDKQTLTILNAIQKKGEEDGTTKSK